jgi:hypothetical protein
MVSETYEAVQTIGGRWEIRAHHDDCAEGIPLNEVETRRAVAALRAVAGISAEALEAGALAKALSEAIEVVALLGNEGDELDRADMMRTAALVSSLRALGIMTP